VAGPVIGPAIPGWETPPGEDEKKIILTGLPDPFPAELAWMAHWQEVIDGTPATVQTINQLALVLRHASATTTRSRRRSAARLVLRHPLAAVTPNAYPWPAARGVPSSTSGVDRPLP
jgi:hypothetical protein